MRTLIFFGFLTLTLGLRAQVLEVTPKTLESWIVTGADKTELAKAASLVLPAGTQLARSFSGSDLAVTLVTQPGFPVAAQDWPVLEVGSAVVVLSRHGDSGQILLIIGDKPPAALATPVKLDADGHSAEPLTLSLGESAGVVRLTVEGESVESSAGTTGATKNVVISAGAGDVWPIDSLVVIGGDTVADPSSRGGRNSSQSGEDGETIKPTSAPTGPFLAGHVGDSGSSVKSASDKPQTPLSGRGGALEVYTPPSVRLGRADAVRAALGGRQGK